MQELKFKAYLAANGIRQDYVGELIGVNRQSVNRKINGKEPFTLKQIKIICKHFGLSADEYFL